MKRVLVFEGAKAAEQFRLLGIVKDMGVSALIEEKERTLDDAEGQADLDDLFEAIGVRFEEAKVLGTVDAEILEEYEVWQKNKGKEGFALYFRPRTATGAHLLYLRPSTPAPRMVLEAEGSYKLLVRLLQKAAPKAAGRLARDVRDIRKFVADAPESVDGSLPADKPLLKAVGESEASV